MVDGFLRKMKDALVGGDEQYDQDANTDQYGNVRPASEDPYGDPANQVGNYEQFGDVRPASEDPYGDPGNYEQAGYGQDYGQFGDVRPASEDPYGDPADQ